MAKGRMLLIGALMASSVLVGGVAQAEEGATKSKVTIKESKKGFKGSVSSADENCIADRDVTVYKERKKKKDEKVASTSTDESGDWKAKVNDADGKYYATVSRSVYSDEYGALYECKKDSSDSVKVG